LTKTTSSHCFEEPLKDGLVELGPPDKQAKLSDGKTVAEWITRRSGGSGLSVSIRFFGGGVGSA
jgi:hypothetical protein